MTTRTCADAPTRVDFVGGWTDVQPFCDEDAGIVVNAALSEYAARPSNRN